MSIGDQISYLIRKHGITRLKLSEDTSVPYTTLTQIINGRTKNPQVKALEAIADYFNVPFDYILGNSVKAIIDKKLDERKMTLEQLSTMTKIPVNSLENLDRVSPYPGDYDNGGVIFRISSALGIDFDLLANAYSRQEPPAYDGPSISPEEAFKQIQEDFAGVDFDGTEKPTGIELTEAYNQKIKSLAKGDQSKSAEEANVGTEFETIAAHHDGDEWTEEELEEIERFKEFVRMKRKKH